MNILDKVTYTALIEEVILQDILWVTLITKLDMYTCIEKALLTKSCFENLIFVYICFCEDERVSLKGDFSTFCSAFANNLKV